MLCISCSFIKMNHNLIKEQQCFQAFVKYFALLMLTHTYSQHIYSAKLILQKKICSNEAVRSLFTISATTCRCTFISPQYFCEILPAGSEEVRGEETPFILNLQIMSCLTELHLLHNPNPEIELLSTCSSTDSKQRCFSHEIEV